MMTMMRSILILLMLASVVACVRPVKSNVQNFSNLPADYIGKSVAVRGYPQEIDSSLEWQAYKPVFERQFADQGFTITDFDSADYVAFVTYGIGDPQTSTGIGTTATSTFSYTRTRYARTVEIRLIDKATEQRLFESKATSTGRCGLIGAVIDEIAEAMFDRFPSGSGRARTFGEVDC